jgi:transposase
MDVKSKQRRRHSAQFKAEVIAACGEPGASVAAVARRFDLNDNLVHQWRRGRGSRGAKAIQPHGDLQLEGGRAEFVALSLPAPAAPPASPPPATSTQVIRIELKRGSTSVNVSWPMSASAECGAWLQELLR